MMNHGDWINQVMAAAEPLEGNRAVRLMVLEDYADALQLCRILDFQAPDGKSLHQDITDNLERGDARFVAGLCGRGETACSFAGAFFRDNKGGRRHARVYFFFGPRSALAFMQERTAEIHQTYRRAMAEEGAFPVNRNPNN